MSFVICDPKTGIIVVSASGTSVFETVQGAATSLRARQHRAQKRLIKNIGVDRGFDRAIRESEEVAGLIIVTLDEYDEKYAKTKKVKNLMSGVEIEIDVNTPRCCDPSSELYWTC